MVRWLSIAIRDATWRRAPHRDQLIAEATKVRRAALMGYIEGGTLAGVLFAFLAIP